MSTEEHIKALVSIQQEIVRLVATSAAGHNLLLIGGFRYRFLDQSVRMSRDIDYHWSGDLVEKQQELVALFRKRLLPSMRRKFEYEGRADPATGPDAESPAVRIITVAFWKKADAEFSRIEIPVEILRVICFDKTGIRTVDGVVYPTLSDADMIESKIVAVFNRRIMEHRDLVDVFLFSSKLIPNSSKRLRHKLKELGITGAEAQNRLNDFDKHASYHIKAIQAVIDSQLDPEASENIKSAGGAKMILAKTIEIIRSYVTASEAG